MRLPEPAHNSRNDLRLSAKLATDSVPYSGNDNPSNKTGSTRFHCYRFLGHRPLCAAFALMKNCVPGTHQLWKRARTGLINPRNKVRIRPRPATKAGLVLYPDAVVLYMRPVLARKFGCHKIELLQAWRPCKEIRRLRHKLLGDSP
jgi:hypothetical protein